MKLPRGEAAVVDARRVVSYVLAREHPVGRHKARVFERALGLGPADSQLLVSALKAAAESGEAVRQGSDVYGVRYQIDFEFTLRGRTARVRSGWLVPKAPEPPRFLSARVL